ncbi:hypothetical protein [Xenorhabdus anantnagensis]|uniref:Uncharacterized protein n=1 Tax=Xenorhabdus anantnagensis TaxID=3025875 RepID=A0ABT5LU19_9GAMM|nr:hypothetical protein [Xenorhabdus anantnagensis]MDC9597353.1 hypothetical protein [Xenorhabdus anantnagensis]
MATFEGKTDWLIFCFLNLYVVIVLYFMEIIIGILYMDDEVIFNKYEILNGNLLKSNASHGMPYLMLAQKDGECFLIKYWLRVIESDDDILESVWQHELRQLQRLKGYPGVGDYIVYPIEAKKSVTYSIR